LSDYYRVTAAAASDRAAGSRIEIDSRAEEIETVAAICHPGAVSTSHEPRHSLDRKAESAVVRLSALENGINRPGKLISKESTGWPDNIGFQQVEMIDSVIPSVASGSYPARAGNALYPLIDGEPTFRRICEAIDMARSSVWVTVAFMWASFEMPDGRGTPLDVLGRAAERGLDVRMICWRPDAETEQFKRNAFWGSEDHFNQLQAGGLGIRIRWDRAQPGFCQHQKSWLIDAGEKTEIAFIGGINLNPHSMVAPGHHGEGQNHDVYVELVGTSTVDVHHNFVQRWNEASERDSSDGRWGQGSDDDLPFPTTVPCPRGNAIVQIQRTVHSGRYTDGRSTPQGLPFNVTLGERSNFDQYSAAIGAARSSIYIEHQCITVPDIVGSLHQALQRNVEVTLVLPAEQTISSELLDLVKYENLTLAGIAGVGFDGERKPVWVHAKLMVVDDVWATIGSCNLHYASLFGNAELNAACWHPDTARTLRAKLLQEHLDHDTSNMDDRAALRLFRKIAMANRRRFDIGENAWQGLAFSLVPAVNFPINAGSAQGQGISSQSLGG
jgi:cardiolipin synthase